MDEAAALADGASRSAGASDGSTAENSGTVLPEGQEEEPAGRG